MTTYLLWLNDQQAGPFTKGQLKSMWQQGQLTRETLYWRDDMQQWLALGDLVEDEIVNEIAQRAATVPTEKKPPVEEPPAPAMSVGKFIFWLLLIGAGLWFYISVGGLPGLEQGVARHTIQAAQPTLDEIHKQVAADSVKQYEIAKRNGDAMDIYTQASLVTAAFLQAGDEINYRKWKKIEADAGVAAGLPPSP